MVWVVMDNDPAHLERAAEDAEHVGTENLHDRYNLWMKHLPAWLL